MFAVSIITDGTPFAGVTNMINVQQVDPVDLEQDRLLLLATEAVQTINITDRVEQLKGNVDTLIEHLERVTIGDSTMYCLNTINSACGAVQTASYAVRDVYDPQERFQSQRSR
jgi:hypothetical protein